MHWLLVSARHHPDHGGIGAAVAAFVARAVEHGWQVDLVTRAGGAPPLGARVHAVPMPDDDPSFAERVPRLRKLEAIRPYRYGLWALAAARKLLEIDVTPDAVEFVDNQAEGVVALASPRVRARFAGVPMIVAAHTPMFLEEAINGVDAARFGRPTYHAWEREALEAADGVIVTSHLLRQRLGRSLDVVIPYALQTPPVADDPEAETDSEAERLVLVGTVQPRKGIDVWARSLGRVLSERPGATAELIGPDTPTAPDGGSMADWTRGQLAPELAGRFTYRGPLGHDATLEAIASARLIVAPSRFDSFGLAAAEAILCERPLVASSHVGLLEHVRGVPAPPAGDDRALAAAQLRLLRAAPEPASSRRRRREELRRACAPEYVLARRAAFVRTLTPRQRPHRVETIDRMEAFLGRVERAETRPIARGVGA